jgi:hypothetical protein
MCRISAASIVVLLGLAVGAQAQTYKIQLKEYPEPGKKITQTSTEQTKETVKVTVKDAVVKDEKKTESKEKVYTVEVVEKGTARPKVFKKNYTKATSTKDEKATALPHEGRTIVYELKGDNYKVRAEGDPPLAASDLKKMEENVNTSDRLKEVLLPTKEVAVGDTWKVDSARVADVFGKTLPIDPAKSTIQGKLSKAYKKGGHQFGVLEYELKLAVVSLGPLKLKNPGALQLTLKLDTCIDGSSTEGTMTTTGKLQAKAEVEQGGQTVIFDLQMDANGREQISAEK